MKVNSDGSVTITKTVTLTEGQKSEARGMLFMLRDDDSPTNIVRGDGYFAQSIESKFGLDLETLAEISGYNAKKRERAKRLRGFSW
jgi:hypothetical protein